MTTYQLKHPWCALVLVIAMQATCGCDKKAISDLIPTATEKGGPEKIVTERHEHHLSASKPEIDAERFDGLLIEWKSQFEAVKAALLANDIQSALRNYHQLEKIGVELGESGDIVFFALLLDVNGAIEMASGNHQAALESYEQAFSIALESDMEQMPLVALAVDLGCCYRMNGRLEEVAEVLEAALNDMQEVGADLQSMLVVIDEIYDVHVKLGNTEKAIEVLECGLEIFLPVVDQQFNVVATLGMLAAELTRASGDQTRFRDYIELCQALDNDFELDPKIRQKLSEANLLDKNPTTPATTASNDIAFAESVFEEALRRFQRVERNWNAEQARVKRMLDFSNQRAGQMAAQGQTQPHLLMNMDYDTFLEREYYDARHELEEAKEKLARAQNGDR